MAGEVCVMGVDQPVVSEIAIFTRSDMTQQVVTQRIGAKLGHGRKGIDRVAG